MTKKDKAMDIKKIKKEIKRNNTNSISSNDGVTL